MVGGAKPMLRNDGGKERDNTRVGHAANSSDFSREPGRIHHCCTAKTLEESQFISIIDTLSSRITLRRIGIFSKSAEELWSKV
jgi:hypothetical protein